MLIAGFSTIRQNMLFNKDTPLLVRAAATASLAVGTLLILLSARGPVFRCKSGAGTLMPVSVAGDMLGGLGAGLAGGGPRFVQAVACTGSAGASSGHAGPCGACC